MSETCPVIKSAFSRFIAASPTTRSVSGYLTIVLENGDKIFARVTGTSQTSTNPDGSQRSVATDVMAYTGGTWMPLTLRYLPGFCVSNVLLPIPRTSTQPRPPLG